MNSSSPRTHGLISFDFDSGIHVEGLVVSQIGPGVYEKKTKGVIDEAVSHDGDQGIEYVGFDHVLEYIDGGSHQ